MLSQPLYPYQTRVSEFAKDKPRVGIFVAYGGGKTYLSLKWLEDLQTSGQDVLPCLVLTTKSLIYQWGEQITEHSNFTYSLVEGSAKQKQEALKKDVELYVANYDLLRSSKILAMTGIGHRTWESKNKVQHAFKATTTTRFRTVIVDESTALKEARTQRFKSLYAFCSRLPNRTILTGKPILEKPEEIFAQMLFLDDGVTFGKAFWYFRDKYFSPGPPWAPYDWTLKPFAEQQIAIQLNRSCIHIPEEEVAKELPPKRYIKVFFQLSESVRERYKQLKRDFSMELLEGGTYDTQWAVTRSQKMHQLCQGLFYTTDGGYELLHTLKLDWLHENIPLMLQNGPVLIWTDLVRWVSLLGSVLGVPYRTFTGEMTLALREAAKKDFQDGKVDVLILSQQAGHKGLNLQRANQAVFVSTGYWADARANAEKRCHRIGSEKHEAITYYDLIVKSSLDEVILEAIQKKLDMAEEILKHIQKGE